MSIDFHQVSESKLRNLVQSPLPKPRHSMYDPCLPGTLGSELSGLSVVIPYIGWSKSEIDYTDGPEHRKPGRAGKFFALC